jgi:hypothetical protein
VDTPDTAPTEDEPKRAPAEKPAPEPATKTTAAVPNVGGAVAHPQ